MSETRSSSEKYLLFFQRSFNLVSLSPISLSALNLVTDHKGTINCMQPHIESCIIAEYSAGDIFANQLRRLNF
jgi:hypothetical protein